MHLGTLAFICNPLYIHLVLRPMLSLPFIAGQVSTNSEEVSDSVAAEWSTLLVAKWVRLPCII